MKAQPISDCPVCKVPVKWILHDGLNSYDCSNKQCPIEFTERVYFPSETQDFDFDSGHGELHYYNFRIGKYPVAVDCRDELPKIILYPNYPFGDLKGGSIIIEQPLDVNWDDLELLEQKIRTWIVFS
jgi:hypothetical protein